MPPAIVSCGILGYTTVWNKSHILRKGDIHMKRSLFPRLTAAALSLVLLSTPAVQALTVEQTAALLQELYVDDVPQSVLEQPTIRDMLNALGDPYTQYFTPEEYAEFNASMSDSSLVGIGVVYSQTEEGILLSEVLEGSPAEKGGLEAGDLIIKVDGRSVLGEDTNTINGWIRGEEGSSVLVTYLRNGRRKTVTLTRALVILAATTTELIDDHIGYISCTTFGAETVQHFQEGIEKYQDKADVWIVDLRSNSGGVTQAAVDAAGCFTGPGEMAYMRNGLEEYGAYYHREKALSIYPVIVLVDQYSASASEIFASAIREHGMGIVVGTRSYGKGVAQSVLDQESMPDFFPDGDAIKITSHRFFTPYGNSTDQVGVIPDLLVEEDLTGSVAYLLAGSGSVSDTTGVLRVDLSWRWLIDMETALSVEYIDVFQSLVDAIPDNKRLWLGTGGPDGWEMTGKKAICEKYDLEYHDPVFSDQETSAYDVPLRVLKTYDLIHGKGDGMFYPLDTLTRAELCQLLSSALNCAVPGNESPYSDVSDDSWYAPAVIAMTNMGLVNGVGDSLFYPEEPVDHQQFITIMGRLAQQLNMYLYNDAREQSEGTLNIPELADYADWAKGSAWLLSYSQSGYFGNTISLLWDSADKIDPTAAATRDEAAYTLYRLLSYTGILPA